MRAGRDSKPRKRSGCAIILLVGIIASPGGVHAQAPSAERGLTLPSGATLKVATDWTLTELEDGLTLEVPEERLKIEVVEVDASAGMSAAISAAWSSRRPGFSRRELTSLDSPGREGWDAFNWTEYESSPEESRTVSAVVSKQGSHAVVLLADMPLADAQRRSSEIELVYASLRPAAYVRESYLGCTPRPLDAARIEELKQFIDRMCEAADVPGASVVLFDRDATLIEAGFGVRERGRPEPVTADSLYMVASNTKPLTTLLLAKLVDEGRFSWETPVVQVYPSFRVGDPDLTKRMLMKHLVSACTGLPRQDFEALFTGESSSPKGQLEVLATMKPTTEFGTLFQYSNPLVSAAGYIAAHAVKPGVELGQAYDEVMRDKIFRPLAMNRTTLSFDEALKTDHASPHSWDRSQKSVSIDANLNRFIIYDRPAGGVWSSVRDYARYVRMELASGRLPDGSTFVSEKNLLERRVPQVRVSEEIWYAMGLSLEEVKGIRVINHGGALIGYMSDFFFVPDLGVGGVTLTNASSGGGLPYAVMRRTLELIYDGKPEVEEDFLSGVRKTEAYLADLQNDWKVPPDPAEVERLAGAYRNGALGKVVVHPVEGELVFQFGSWKSRMASKRNPDGTTSFISIDPGVLGFEFNAPAAEATYTHLTLRDQQHSYEYEAVPLVEM
jgi:CubicO group peptidase (beta-lactamase class C family)